MPTSPYVARFMDLNTLPALQAEMRRLDVDPGGIPIMAAKGVLRLILVEQVPTAAANVIKQEILARGGDLVTPWTASGFEAPLVDVIFIGSVTTLRSTIAKLYRQTVYDLPQIADSVQQVLVHTTPGYLPVSPRPSRQGVVVEETLEDLMGGRIALEPGTHRAPGRPTLAQVPGHTWRFGELTYVMGIVNATPDSFSDDGLDRDQDAAMRRIEQVVAEGAHIVDIGGESSEARDHGPIAVQEEIGRVVPLIRWTRRNFPHVLVSVDTWKAAVAAAAVEAGAQIINDVGAMRRDPGMKRVAAESGLPVVLMHSQESTVYVDLVSDVARFFHTAMAEALAAGVREEQIILDAGFGFGKTVHQDLALTRRLRELTGFGRPLLHAPSRKRTIGRVLGYPNTVEERLPGTAATVSIGIANGADIVRVHDVLDMVRCCKMTDALVRGYAGPDE
ncbi:MAG TPA: dihydropteroate synthase [Symbiobacteriaceae bacterium]|nr:dihydropteroate synthase [Symbiobacteriaceae bacterium]